MYINILLIQSFYIFKFKFKIFIFFYIIKNIITSTYTLYLCRMRDITPGTKKTLSTKFRQMLSRNKHHEFHQQLFHNTHHLPHF